MSDLNLVQGHVQDHVQGQGQDQDPDRDLIHARSQQNLERVTRGKEIRLV